MEIKTWKDLYKTYPEHRCDMTEKNEREFVEHCFELYEKEGFANKFWSCGGDLKKYHGKSFNVLGRATENEVDLCCLPMWNIVFEDGYIIQAYPDEIIPREMKENGCKLDL